MSRTTSRVAVFAVIALSAQALFAATYIVPTDREMVRRANAIVIGEALASYTQLSEKGAVETVTPFSITEVLKGSIDADSIDVVEPGGRFGKHVTMIPGVPRFTDGEKVLLFLTKHGARRWSLTDLALGRFSFATDRTGRSVAVRAEGDVVGWDPSGEPHKEMRRAADAFIQFIRDEVSGGVGKTNYSVPFEPLPVDPTAARRIPAKTLVVYTPTSYTTDNGGGQGSRWNVFPTAVAIKNANGGSTGATAVGTAISTWDAASGALVSYSNAGTDNCSAGCNGLLGAPDGVNDVLFEVNLSAYGSFSCSSGSFGGLLGLGGVSANSGTHSFAGATWGTTSEVDVAMNTGVVGCVGVGPSFTASYLAIAVTHELGHTLGFRHSDYNRNDSGACDPSSYECTSSAVMYHTVSTGTTGLLTWDLHAADAVYPAPSVNPPTNVTATPTSASTISIQWTAASGAASYNVYRSQDNVNYTLAGSPTGTSFSDTVSTNKAYIYKVRSYSGGESGDSNKDFAVAIAFTDSTLSAGTTQVKAVHLTELRTATDALRLLANNGVSNPGTYTDSIVAGSTPIKAVHITELRTAINNARTTLGFSAASFTNTSISAGSSTVQAVDFTELRNAVK